MGIDMEGEDEITIKDWIDYLRWIVDYIDRSLHYQSNLFIPLVTFLILSFLSLIQSIINYNLLYIILSLIGIIIASIIIMVIGYSNNHLNDQSDDIEELLDELLIYDNIEINDVRIRYMEICSKYEPFGEKSQKRLKDLKKQKEKVLTEK